jgi:hypothetical protein
MVRLGRAHQDLRATNPGRGATVTTIAARWGLHHHSRFAAAPTASPPTTPCTTRASEHTGFVFRLYACRVDARRLVRPTIGVSQCRNQAATMREGSDRLMSHTELTEPTVVAPEPLVTAYAAAPEALRRPPGDVGRPGVAVRIEQAHHALARVGTAGAQVVGRLLAEIRACHQRGHTHSVDLERVWSTSTPFPPEWTRRGRPERP